MFKNSYKFGLLFIITITMIIFVLNNFQESSKNTHIKATQTAMETNSIRLSLKGINLLQRSYIELTYAVHEKDKESLYDALDYLQASQGFLTTENLIDEELVQKIDTVLNILYYDIEEKGLNMSQKELETIHDDIQYIQKEIEAYTKDVWTNFHKNHIEFHTDENEMFQILVFVTLVISILLIYLFGMYIRQLRLNKTILEHEENLNRLAYYDPLTEVPNRKSIEQIIENEIALAKRNLTEFYILMIDIDDFKNINDFYGHDMGDALLVESVKRIQSLIRSEDTLGRFGGDEFILVIKNRAGSLDIITLLNRIMHSFKDPIHIKSLRHYTGLSVGVANYPNDAQRVNELIQNADMAMHRAKHQGKAQYSFFQESFSEIIRYQYEMEPQIKEALENNQFELYYQPQVDTRTKKIVSAEALVRWNHPTKGLLFPDSFIEIIENGFMSPKFGEWVIKQAAYDQNILKEKGIDIDISVNLSVKHIMHKDFYNDITKLVSEINLDLTRFMFEITEYQLLNYKDNTMDVLNKLAETGFIFHLDDFGTGYSSITYLNQVKIDSIKIDKSFIDNIKSENDSCPFVDAIVDMANALGIKTIAEGVENKVQGAYLAKLNCDYLQGYCFSKALPLDQFEKYFFKSVQ